MHKISSIFCCDEECHKKNWRKKTGLWPQQINAWIKSKENISPKNLHKLSKALEVGIEELTMEPVRNAPNESYSQVELIKETFQSLKRIEHKFEIYKTVNASTESYHVMYEVLFNHFSMGYIHYGY